MHKDNYINVSVGIVALNEEKYIPHLLEDLLLQTFPKQQVELLFIDSGSYDSTKQIFETFCTKHIYEYKSIKILENIKQKQACGWNVAISKFTGDMLIRLDAHARIDDDFIEKNVHYINFGESVVGGLRTVICENDNLWSKTLLIAEESIFGSSIASYRRADEEKYVNSMFHACYTREVLRKTGGFNEYLGRTEDNEYHYRIRMHGYKLYYNSKIKSYQIIRNNLRKMLKQKFSNGYWIGLTMYVCPKCLSAYHFVPFLLVISIMFFGFISLFSFNLPVLAVVCLYSIFVIINTIISMFDKNSNYTTLLLFIVFPVLHISYGIGTLFGIFMGLIWKDKFNAINIKKGDI